MSLTSSQALAPSVSGSSGPASIPSPSARTMPTVNVSFDTTGPRCQSMETSESSPQIDWVDPLSSSPVGSLVSPTVVPLEVGRSPSIFGLSSTESSASSDPIGSLLKTSLDLDMAALTGCVVTSRVQATPFGRSISILRYRRDSVAGFDSSGWPTPTETANHCSPSMRRWPSYARFQDAVRKITPRLWEWMMDFPAGWLDCMRWATPSPQPSQSSSDEP